MKKEKRDGRNGSRWSGTLISVACVLVLLLGFINLGDWLIDNLRIKRELGEDSRNYHNSMDAFFERTSIAETFDADESRFWPDVSEDEYTDEYDVDDLEEDEGIEYLPHFGMPVCVDIPLDPEPVIQPVFEEFYERNPDLIGWIEAGGEVDYPMVWRDNEFYMDHDFDGEESIAGAIFLDERNDPDLNDDSLIVYGHNMRVGTMFGQLDLFREKSYVRQNPIVYLHSMWEETPREYAIFSLFDASMNEDDPTYFKITRFSFESDQEKEAFFKDIKDHSMFRLPVDVDASDQIVCLVTCSYSQDNGRLLLYARRLRPEETVEEMKELY